MVRFIAFLIELRQIQKSHLYDMMILVKLVILKRTGYWDSLSGNWWPHVRLELYWYKNVGNATGLGCLFHCWGFSFFSQQIDLHQFRCCDHVKQCREVWTCMDFALHLSHLGISICASTVAFRHLDSKWGGWKEEIVTCPLLIA